MTRQELTLDLIPGGVPPIAHVNQYDSGARMILATIYSGGTAADLSGVTGVTVCGTKSSGTGFSYDNICTVDTSAGTISFDVTEQMTAVAGPVRCGLVLTTADGKIGTLVFILDVQQAALATDTIIDSNDFQSIIADAMSDVQELVDAASSSAAAAGGSATQAAQSATAAESARAAALRNETASATYRSEALDYSKAAQTSAAAAAKSATDAAGYAEDTEAACDFAAARMREADASATAAEASAAEARRYADDLSGVVTTWLDGHVDPQTGYVVDSSLTISGAAADAATAGAQLLAAFATDTASGDIASFSDGADGVPVKSLTVNIEPVQEGSGDPSPDNVRPIKGWAGAKVEQRGKNLLNPDEVVKGDLIAGIVNSGNYLISGFIPVKPGTTYTKSALVEEAVIGETAFYNSQKKYLTRCFVNTFTTPADCYFIRCEFVVGDITPAEAGLMVEFAPTATDYEPYQGDTLSVDWESAAGTVYGGTLDVTTGTLTVDRWWRKMLWRDGIEVAALGSIIRKKYNVPVTVYPPNESKPQLCNVAPYMASYDSRSLHFYINTREGDRNANVYLPSEVNESTEIELCGELATPITHQLTPTEVRTLLGANNIYADTGDVSVTYRADTALYVAKKLAEREVSGA